MTLNATPASADDAGQWTLEVGPFTMRRGLPIVDGQPFDYDECERTTDGARTSVRYRTQELTFTIEAESFDDHTAELTIVLSDFTSGTTWNDFGLRFGEVRGAHSAFRQGFYSWDGSEVFHLGDTLDHHDPLDTHLGFSAQTSHGVTALIDDDHTAVLGVTEAKRMPQTFTYSRGEEGTLALDVSFRWERADTNRLDRVCSDPIRLLDDADTETALRRWAEIFASGMGGGRVAAEPMRGWCSWYYLYYFATEQEIEDNLAGAVRARDEQGVPLDVFLVDANHAAQLGDWLDPHPEFYPSGQPQLIQRIKDAGFIPGLWIGPYWVTNRSRLAQEHPDWLVQDPTGDGPLVTGRYYGEQKIWCYPVEETYILDTTHPDALAYLTRVIATWREWGVEYFKTDFMYMGAIAGRRHDPTKNRLAVWRETAEAMRDAMGDAYWSGCGQPIFPSVGLVDANRMSGDVGPVWTGHLSQESTLRDTLNRNYMHNVFWQNDPDCVLIRDFHHEMTPREIEGLGLYAGMSGGLCLTSDPLHLVGDDALDFFRFISPTSVTSSRAPMMGANLPGLRCFVNDGPNGSHVALFLNSGEEPINHEIPLEQLGVRAGLHALEIRPRLDRGEIDAITVDLAPHDFMLVYLSPAELGTWGPAHLLDHPV